MTSHKFFSHVVKYFQEEIQFIVCYKKYRKRKNDNFQEQIQKKYVRKKKTNLFNRIVLVSTEACI